VQYLLICQKSLFCPLSLCHNIIVLNDTEIFAFFFFFFLQTLSDYHKVIKFTLRILSMESCNCSSLFNLMIRSQQTSFNFPDTHIFYTYYESTSTFGEGTEQACGTVYTVSYDCSNLVEFHTIITPTKCTLLLLKAPDITICTLCLIFCPCMFQPA
jgi:hypothetical protein